MLGDFLGTNNINFLQILIVGIGYLMPIPLAYIAVQLWHHYRQEDFISGIKWTLLEIQVPRDVIKSPLAMELIFSNAMYHRSGKGFWEQFVMGAPWLWFSLEIASIDGRVRFFIRTPSRIRGLVETQIYAQYPQAKVVEAEDYTMNVPQYSKDGDYDTWGCEFNKLKEDFLPIKTYRGFGDDMKTGVKEEFRIDPITPIIEFLGSIPNGQQVWIQILARQNIITYHSHKTGKHIGFYDAAQEFLSGLLQPYSRFQKNDNSPADALTYAQQVGMPETLKPIVTAVNDQLNKLHFDCGIRVVTISDKKKVSFDEFMNLRRNARLIWRQYAQPNINELNRINSTQFDAPWSDPTGLALHKMKKRMIDFYRMRTFFHPPLQYAFQYPFPIKIFFPPNVPKLFVLSSEELATLYHFPGMVSETPSFKRIESKIAKPPSNLPI